MLYLCYIIIKLILYNILFVLNKKMTTGFFSNDYKDARDNYKDVLICHEEIDAWEQGVIDFFSPTTSIPGINSSMKKSVFQLCFEKENEDFNFTTVLEETGEFIVIVPADFRSKTHPSYNSVNPAMTRIGGNSALMSLVHVLVIPKKRIYNALTLWKKDIPLIKRMQDAAKKWVTYLSNADETVPYSREWTINGLASLDKTMCKDYKIMYYDMSEMNECRSRFMNKSRSYPIDVPVETSFHINESIGWLHMHGFAKDCLTTGYNFHNEKNISVDSVLSEISNLQETTISGSVGNYNKNSFTRHIQVGISDCGKYYDLSYKFDNLTKKQVTKIDENGFWGDIIYKNEMTEKMIKYLLMNNDELYKVVGHSPPDIYKCNILKGIQLLWD